MKVQNIQPNISYTAKPHNMTLGMRNNIEKLLLKMNYSLECAQHGDSYEFLIIKKLYDNNNNVFEDSRRLLEKFPSKKQMQGFSSLKMGDSWMDFDNETSKIVDYSKPFYMPWFIFAKKAEKILENLNKFYTNSSKVMQEKMAIRSLTPDGWKKIQKYILKVEKERLENITKELEQCN